MSDVFNIIETPTQFFKVIERGPQGTGGSGGLAYVTDVEPTGVTTGAIWFAPTARLLSVYDGTQWIAQQVDIHETFTQATPLSVWNVVHGMGKFPGVEVIDSAGDEVFGDVHHINNSSLTITFSAPFSGFAYLN